jgi:hypothetical protein
MYVLCRSCTEVGEKARDGVDGEADDVIVAATELVDKGARLCLDAVAPRLVAAKGP